MLLVKKTKVNMHNKINCLKYTIASRMYLARMKTRLTQGQVANIMNIHVSVIKKYETGKKSIKLEDAALFAELYNVTLNYMIGNEKNNIKKNIDVEKSVNNYVEKYCT